MIIYLSIELETLLQQLLEGVSNQCSSDSMENKGQNRRYASKLVVLVKLLGERRSPISWNVVFSY